MSVFRSVATLLCLGSVAFGQQLTKDQKILDFTNLAALYAKNYGPYELHRDLFGFDLLNIQPWLDQVNNSKTDLDFYDILARYVGSFKSGHDVFLVPSDFIGWLHMSVDMYDGKVLVDGLDRAYLPRARYPFTTGDEIVSIDGTAAADWIESYQPYANFANPVSRQRSGAGSIVLRFQEIYPGAVKIGNNATLVVNQQSGGTQTYTIPWDKFGTPLMQQGPVPSPRGTPAVRWHTPVPGSSTPAIAPPTFALKGVDAEDIRVPVNPWGVYTGLRPAGQGRSAPSYMQPLTRLWKAQHKSLHRGDANNLGAFEPVFSPPAGFKLRLGAGPFDEFLSGTYTSGTTKIGFIRIPSFEPFTSVQNAEDEFESEMQYFQKNMDVVVVDVMNNPGGDACYAQDLVSFMNPSPFSGVNVQIRATQSWILDFSSALTDAENNAAPQWVINLFGAYLKEVQQAYSENRGMTGMLPLCGPSLTATPATDSNGHNVAFTKPILVLTDTYSVSSAEVFSLLLQDAGRATLFGMRTDGDGGNDPEFPTATAYTEGAAVISVDLLTRSRSVAVPGFPSMPFYEGVGVYPDIVEDYMTKSNLLTGGQTFVADFTAAANSLVQH